MIEVAERMMMTKKYKRKHDRSEVRLKDMRELACQLDSNIKGAVSLHQQSDEALKCNQVARLSSQAFLEKWLTT